jgi:hypothetical protein
MGAGAGVSAVEGDLGAFAGIAGVPFLIAGRLLSSIIEG